MALNWCKKEILRQKERSGRRAFPKKLGEKLKQVALREKRCVHGS